MRWKLEINVLPITWVYRVKLIDLFGQGFLHKARCCVRGDRQVKYVDSDPHRIYNLDTSHKAFCILLTYAASQNLIVEERDVACAYL